MTACPGHDPDAGHDPGARGVAVIELLGGQRGQLEERRAGIAEPLDAFAWEQLPAAAMALAGLLAASMAHTREALLQVRDQLQMTVAVLVDHRLHDRSS